MPKTPSETLEYIILEMITGPNPNEGTHQDSIAGWKFQMRHSVPETTEPNLIAAFKRLARRKVIRLTQPVGGKYHGKEYSWNDEDDVSFFSGQFNATIEPEGRAHWEELRRNKRDGVFISHIFEERHVAFVLQKYLKLAFGNDFRVFVSSDKTSINTGHKWFNHILEHLRKSEVVISLLSQESRRREWINFEVGFGDGAESLVLPLAIKNMPLGQLDFPLRGYQARNIDEVGAIIGEIKNRIGIEPKTIDIKAYLEELKNAEAEVTYKSLVVEPEIAGKHVRFTIQNKGNIDLELLMLQVLIPGILQGDDFPFPGDGMERSVEQFLGNSYRSYSCYSPRGAYGGITPVLRPILTTSMGVLRPNFSIPIRRVGDNLKDLSIFFQVHAINYRSEMEERKISEIPVTT